jgi:protein-S-isoprenylcysteine O-methyltransferase Ste14
MIYIITGSVAFLLFVVFDYYTLNNEGTKKKIFGLGGLLLFTYSTIMAIITSKTLNIPIAVRVVSALFWFVFLFLLIYSLFLELPFVKTYGKEQHSRDLIETGTYGLCRHPGVLWFGLLFLCTFLVTGSTLIAIGGIVWTSIDVIHVYIQEKVFFCKMFEGYDEYIKSTPMLIPNIRSVKKCKETIFRGWE